MDASDPPPFTTTILGVMFARLRLCNDYKALPLVWEYGFDDSPTVRVALVQASERKNHHQHLPMMMILPPLLHWTTKNSNREE